MQEYRGRFAPSPTGPLHFGSLFAAVISYLDAKRQQGKWLVRIENIDPPREQEGAIASILSCLEKHGLHADEDILFQSSQGPYYETLLDRLHTSGQLYLCPCSRKQLTEEGEHLPSCQSQEVKALPCATKFRSDAREIHWEDGILGSISYPLVDDFVLKRKDGLYAYQLAVVADDIQQGITHVVRGADLLDSTPMQLALYQALNASEPKFSHFPVVKNDQGQKLSKQNLAHPVNAENAVDNLRTVLSMLGISYSIHEHNCKSLLATAIPQWQPERVAARKDFTEPSGP